MTPIEKNIRVVDEQGHEYEATYPKRAEGLVKNGRARFIDENIICLACPPDITEEKQMSNNQNNKNIEKSEKTTAEKFTDSVQKAMSESENNRNPQAIGISYSLEYALEQLEKVRAESVAFAERMFEMIANNKSTGSGDIGAQANGTTLEEFAKLHEATIQKQIDFYQKMVNQLNPQSSDFTEAQIKFLDFVEDCCSLSKTVPDYATIWKMITE